MPLAWRELRRELSKGLGGGWSGAEVLVGGGPLFGGWGKPSWMLGFPVGSHAAQGDALLLRLGPLE